MSRCTGLLRSRIYRHYFKRCSLKVNVFICFTLNSLRCSQYSLLFLQTGTAGVICYKNQNNVKVTSFRALERFRPLFNKGLVAGTKLLYKSYQNGQVFCSFRRRVITPSGSEFYMLDLSQNQHAVWAMGPLARDNLPDIHFFTAVSGEPIDIRFRVCKSRIFFVFKNSCPKYTV